MGTNELIGTIIVVGVPLIVGIIALVRPIINLNSSITKLNLTMEQLVGENTCIKAQLKEHDDTLSEHEIRLRLMEFKKESQSHEQ